MESIKSKLILYSRTISAGFRFICIDKNLDKDDRSKMLYDVHTFWDLIDNRQLLLNRKHLIVRLAANTHKVCMYKIYDASAGTSTRATCSLEGFSFDSNLSVFLCHAASQFYLNTARLDFNVRERDEEKEVEYVFSNCAENGTAEYFKLRYALFDYLTSSDNVYDFIIVEDNESAEKPFQVITLNGALPLELKKYIK